MNQWPLTILVVSESVLFHQAPAPGGNVDSGDVDLEGLPGDLDGEEIAELLDELAADLAAPREIAARPPAREQDYTRKGNVIYERNRKVGTINYLLHWEPASFSASCCVHDSCYVTAAADRVDEDKMVRWLQDGPRFADSESHMAMKPDGAYNKRRRKE